MKWIVSLLLAGTLATGCSTIAPEKKVRKPISVTHSVTDEQFRRSLGHLLSAPTVNGNNVIKLENGDQIFPAMLAAIRKAQHSITFENYIWNSGKVSDSFIEALTERARAGVKVHALIDSKGSKSLSSADRSRLREAGAQLVSYNSFNLFRPFGLNHRTHRKLLVVDGRFGFAGGVCLRDDWAGNGDQPKHWRDLHFAIEGPVVAEIQTVFMENWLQAHSEILHGDDYFPKLEPAGEMSAHFFRSGPRDSAENARISYLYAIDAARTNIRLAHAYFVPGKRIIEALLRARQRGVEIQIIVPAKNDNFVVNKASRSRWGELLKAGVKFFEYQPSYYHCKVMIVDDAWVTLGSVNLDERSLRFNDEANLNVLSPTLAHQLTQTFDSDKSKCRTLTEKNYKRRNFVGKVSDRFFGIFGSQL
jgi:cardiolipin synthase